MNNINYLWRVVATGISFLVFGLGGLLIGIVVYPLLFLLGSKKYRHQHGQLIIHLCFKSFAWFMKNLGIFSLKVLHKERLNRANLYLIANHPTLIDVVILLSIIKQSDCVVKSKLAQNVVTKGPLLAAGYIINDTPDHLLDCCAKSLQTGRNLLIFPEGTRTKNMNELIFKRGAALIAIKAKHDITPITIKCQPRMLAKGQKWYKIPSSKPHFHIAVGNDINILEYLNSDESLSIRSRKLSRMLLNYYSEELQIGKNNN